MIKRKKAAGTLAGGWAAQDQTTPKTSERPSGTRTSVPGASGRSQA